MSPEPKKRDLVVTRLFEAPPDRVWKAWTDPEQVMRWWGPTGFTAPVASIDFREGGTSLVCMRSPDGQDLYNTWTYGKIEPVKQFEFVHNFSDRNGKKVDPVTLGLPADLPQDMRSTVVLTPVEGSRTEMTVTEYGYTSDQMLNLSKAGLEQCLDKMGDSLKG